MNREAETRLLARMGRLPVTVGGISMKPALQKGDVVLCRSQDTYEIGDIVIYYNPDTSVTIHRIVRKNKKGYMTKGDNYYKNDAYISFDAIIGKALVSEKNPEKIAVISRREASLCRITPFFLYTLIKKVKMRKFKLLQG